MELYQIYFDIDFHSSYLVFEVQNLLWYTGNFGHVCRKAGKLKSPVRHLHLNEAGLTYTGLNLLLVKLRKVKNS